jgi:DUF4097 and DUF4098 domain-containing protein YvlB
MSHVTLVAIATLLLATPFSGIAGAVPAPVLAGDVAAGPDGAAQPSAAEQERAARREQERVQREQAREVQRERRKTTVTKRKPKAMQEARDTRTYKVEKNSALSISNLAGDIEVMAAPGNEVRIDMVRRAYADSDEAARQQLEATQVDVQQHGTRIDVRAMHGGSHNHVEVRFTITAPAALLVDVRSMAGDITLKGFKGETRAETMSGSIVAADLGALSSAKTMSGDIELTACAAGNEMTASSVSGEVTAAGVKARSCSFGSVSGDVGLKEVVCERAIVRTVNGDLLFAGPLDKGGRYEFKSHSGNVQLVVDGRTGFELDARTFSGALRSDLPLSSRTEDTADRPRHGPRSLQGLFGDGSAEIMVVTFSGDVTVAKK